METARYTKEQFENGIPPSLALDTDDSWIAYHGTSNLAEPSIEVSGFTSTTEDAWSIEEVDLVCSVFRELHWAGLNPGGYAVLVSFTSADFKRGGGKSKALHFAEGPTRALGYAVRSMAGGETARALRLAIDDLRALHANDRLRVDHLREQWREWRSRATRLVVVPATDGHLDKRLSFAAEVIL